MRLKILAGLGLLITLKASALSHHPQEFLHTIRGKPNEGAAIVQHFCANCHAQQPLIELGAPKMHQAKDWHERLKQGQTLLLKHTQEGLGAMPPRGGCFECTDQQLALAIAYLLAK